MRSWMRSAIAIVVVVVAAGVLGAVDGAAAQQVLLFDDFAGPTLDASVWGIGTWEIGDRTEFGNAPTFGVEGSDAFVTLPLDTYNPGRPGQRLLGSEIYSLERWDPNGGVEYRARARLRSEAPGLVAAFFTYHAERRRGRWISDEIDFEMLSKQPVDRVLVSSWDDWGVAGSNYDDGIHHRGEYVTPAGFDRRNWNLYAIRWYPDRVEWWVNDELVDAFTAPVPDLAQPVRANLWAGGTTWPDAYDPGLAPVATEAENRRFEWDIDFIHVTRLSGEDGGGDLAAPSALAASVSGFAVSLSWTDASANEEGFRVYRAWRPKGKAAPDFEPVGTTGANATSFVDTAQDGTFLYLVRAYAGSDESPDSNVVTVGVGSGGSGGGRP